MQTQTPALVEGALYLADNGRVICAKCAGASALYTGVDVSGQRVSRFGVADVREWLSYGIGDARCERGCVTLSPIAGPDGWPLAK